MSDINVEYAENNQKLVFADPLDDSGDGDVVLANQTYYTQDEIIGLLNELGFNVSDER